MLTDRDGLWYRVLKARYDEEGGRFMERGQLSSRWWRTICEVKRGVGLGVDSCFDDNSSQVLGDGSSTYFWTDNWVGGVPLRDKYPRLFALAMTRGRTMAEMAYLGWEIGGGAWVWRRRLFAWKEEELRECSLSLSNIILQEDTNDKWRLLLDPIHGYSVNGAYQYLTASDTPSTGHRLSRFWQR